MTKIAVLMACHNRKDKTLAALDSLFHQADHKQDVFVEVVLVDDGSTDGTASAVTSRFPRVTVVSGDGSLYWSGAMALAQRNVAIEEFDHLLWLNDDVVLSPEALGGLLLSSREHPGAIMVGATKWIHSDQWSYGGARLRNQRRPTSLSPAYPGPADSHPQPVDAFNGNVVLVPQRAAVKLGPIDCDLRHAYGDIDYGLRARRAGVSSFMHPESVGTCDGHPAPKSWEAPGLTFIERVRAVFARKGIPIDAHWRFVRRHGGRLAPVYFGASYAKALVDVVKVSFNRTPKTA